MLAEGEVLSCLTQSNVLSRTLRHLLLLLRYQIQCISHYTVMFSVAPGNKSMSLTRCQALYWV